MPPLPVQGPDADLALHGLASHEPLFGRATASGRTGFTLVEIMIVISIIAVVFAMGVPSLFRMMSKDPMRQAVSDVLEACQQARAEAILRDTTTELRFDLEDGGFWDITVVPRPKHHAELDVQPDPSVQSPPDSAPAPAPIFHARISNRIFVDALGVNFKDAIADQEPPAPVRFYANGTCDEFTIVLHWLDQPEWRKISLDIITGLPDVEMIR
ncbi:MAG: type II secretion system GspH family protein [Verrucomicrobia bacterium]|nr:type II secretion system GspH family protein [Verrucomicrobiota bacterium]